MDYYNVIYDRLNVRRKKIEYIVNFQVIRYVYITTDSLKVGFVSEAVFCNIFQLQQNYAIMLKD